MMMQLEIVSVFLGVPRIIFRLEHTEQHIWVPAFNFTHSKINYNYVCKKSCMANGNWERGQHSMGCSQVIIIAIFIHVSVVHVLGITLRVIHS